MVDPRTAYTLDTGLLRTLIPRLDIRDVQTIRTEFARALTSRQGREATSWQEAWNRWTGASENRPGSIRYSTTCNDCGGRGFAHRNMARNLARTGSPHMCGNCGGVPRRQIPVRVEARFAPLPAPPIDEHDAGPSR